MIDEMKLYERSFLSLCAAGFLYRYILSINSAGGVFGKGADAARVELYHIPDDIGQISIPFDFQNDRGVSCRYGDTFRIQKVSTMQGGTEIVVDRYSDITGRKQVRFSCIINDRFRPKPLRGYFGVEFGNKRIRTVTHPCIVAIYDRLRLIFF